jgi:hypothetical protein
LRKQAEESITTTSGALLDSINIGVSTVFANQRKLEKETQALLGESARFSKQTTRWLTLLDGFNKSLKVSDVSIRLVVLIQVQEIGDIENWAKVIEKDMTTVATTLESIHQTTASQPSLVE